MTKKTFSESEVALAREFCRQDFYFFVRWMFYHNKGIDWIKNSHHEVIARAMNDVFHKKTTRLIINIAPRYGKCIAPTARVMTTRGMIEAQSIMAGDDVYTYDEGKLTTEKCLGIEPARKRSLKLTMRSGRSLTMSHDHPMLGIDGYTKAEDFVIGDVIKGLKDNVVVYDGNMDAFAWDTIKNIEDVGETDLIHLSINRTHNFIVEGMVSHNTEMVIVLFAAWSLGKYPDSEFIHASYSANLAGENAYNTRQIVTHPEYQAIFPDVQLRADSKSKDHWKTTKGGVFYSTGTGGSCTGYGAGKEREEFGGCILLDDPHKADEARSDTMRNGVLEWYGNTLQSRVNRSDTPIILIMQRLHEQDLAGWLLDGGSGEKWEHVNIPAITPEGAALWPHKHTLEKLREMEQANPYNFSGQYLQMPSPPDGGLFKPEQLKIMEVLPVNERIQWVRGWDLASSTNGDFTVGAKLGRLQDGRLVIGDIVRVKVNADERDAIIQNTASFDGNMCKISLPQDPGQAGKTQILYLTRALQGYRVVSSTESGNKVTRAEPFAAQVNIGNVYILRGAWNQALINEMRMFPNGKNDDQIDALSRCFEQLLTGGMGFKISNAALQRASVYNRRRF